jgi:hypothetical protein
MKRGHIILLGGAALLIVGIAIAAVWGVSFAGRFVSNNTIVAHTTIEPGKSVSAKTDVTEIGRPITLTVGVDRTGGQPAHSDVKLKGTITDSKGEVVSSSEFGDSFVTSIKPQAAGPYTVTITNLGEKSVTIGGTFGYFPIIGPDGKPDINVLFGPGQQGLGMIIAGGVTAVAGVVALIVGGIITIADSRARQGTAASTIEGGITYRKD